MVLFDGNFLKLHRAQVTIFPERNLCCLYTIASPENTQSLKGHGSPRLISFFVSKGTKTHLEIFLGVHDFLDFIDFFERLYTTIFSDLYLPNGLLLQGIIIEVFQRWIILAENPIKNQTRSIEFHFFRFSLFRQKTSKLINQRYSVAIEIIGGYGSEILF